MLEVNGFKKDIQRRLTGNCSPGSRPMSNLEGYNYSFYDPDYCWEPFFKYFVNEKHEKASKPKASQSPNVRKVQILFSLILEPQFFVSEDRFPCKNFSTDSGER